MSWIVRRMSAGDVDAVLALAEQIPEVQRWNREEYERCVALDESGPLWRAGFIAEAERCLVGFSVGKLVAGVCELESIAVSPENRAHGIGRALFDVVANWAQAHGANRVELEVRASNIRAIKLYEQAGLHREGLRRGYYQSPEEDAVLMGKVLVPGGKLS